MDTFLLIIFVALAGISYAMILFLIASGLSIIFGNIGILNLAHGSLYMLGAYFGLAAVTLGGNWWLGLLASGVGVTLVGLVLDRALLSRLYKRINDQVLVTVGLVYIFANLTLWIWGAFPKISIAPSILSGNITAGDYSLAVYRLVLIIIGVVVFIGLWWLQEKTRAGAIIRAGMDDKQMVIGLGINYGLISAAIFSIGAFMAGLAGFLAGPILGVHPNVGFEVTLLAVIVIIVGGVGRVQGTFVGAVTLGLIDSFGRAFLPGSGMFIIYTLLVIILLIKPSGLLGRKQ